MTERQVTELDVRILREVLTGKYLQPSMSLAMRTALRNAVGSDRVDPVLRKLQDMHIIVGYVPVLSEDGAKIVEGLELMWGLSRKQVSQNDPLRDSFGEEGGGHE